MSFYTIYLNYPLSLTKPGTLYPYPRTCLIPFLILPPPPNLWHPPNITYKSPYPLQNSPTSNLKIPFQIPKI
ncbi:hypothetical protein Hanom_Chr12g01071851 [Helianthus anomalus]